MFYFVEMIICIINDAPKTPDLFGLLNDRNVLNGSYVNEKFLVAITSNESFC